MTKIKKWDVLVICILLWSIVTIFTLLMILEGSENKTKFQINSEILKSPNLNVPRHVNNSNHLVTSSGIPGSVNTKFFKYSAFHDTVNDNYNCLRVIAISSYKQLTMSVRCKILYADGIQITVNGVAELVPEAPYGYRYRSALATCPLNNSHYQPSHVSLAVESDVFDNYIQVTTPSGRNSTITRCYPTLHSNINDVDLILQTIEISRVFGADHFVFYNFSIGSNVTDLLKQYQHIHMVDILPWNLPIDIHNIHYYGQVAAIHDCLYRFQQAKYIVFADLDEMIVPKQHFDWKTLFESSETSRRYGCSAWLFQHAFFPTFNMKIKSPGVSNALDLKCNKTESPNRLRCQQKQRDRSTISNCNKHKLSFLTRTLRTKINDVFVRSKYGVNPKRVEMLGVHKVNKFRNSGYCFVKSETALIHHYRTDWSPDIRPPYTKDLSLLNFQNKILDICHKFWA